jgi:DNA mismatch repair protein MutL
MVSINETSLDYQVTGFVAKPEMTRASRQYMSIIVNGRYIRNYTLARAIQEGYHTLLPIGRYPIVVLSIDMDPSLIDVNVHPSKLEVRLSKEEELSKLLTDSIKGSLKKEVLIPAAQLPKREKEHTEQVPLTFEENAKTEIWQVNEQLEEQEGLSKSQSPSMNREAEAVRSEETETIAFTQTQDPYVRTGEEESSFAEQRDSVESIETPSSSRVPILYPIGQMHGTYIVAQNENGMYLIDQHAAQERIKYEYFREKVGEVEPQLQELLVPFTVECTMQEMTMIEEHMDQLKAVGVFLESFGPQTYIVRSHPTWLPKGEEEETIREMVEQLLKHRHVDIAKLREEAAILMSCKAAIKANRHLRQDEMFALLNTLRKTSDPFTCPHGRPILIHFSTYELEKMFKRVM